ncbi:MAG: glycosyltransferase family 4 protein [Planctomycetota bacterium]
MRILQLTPGTGTFLCGSCLRDNALVLALRDRGHDATIAPLYLPFALEDEPEEESGEAAADAPVHMGGINVYLQQKLPLLRWIPRFLHDRLDSPRLLRWAAGRSKMTETPGLGAMTLSMLRGEEGRQRAELERLVEWARELERPDVVVLSNVMLIGLVHQLKAALGCPVLCTVQGEAPFLDALEPRYRDACWETLADRAQEVDGFLPVSRYTAELMGERMRVPADRMHVVWNGVDVEALRPEPSRRDPEQPAIGFLARMCRDKGIHTLVEAFVRVREEHPNARLVAAGVVLAEDRPLLDELAQRLDAAGCADAAELLGPISREEKVRLLQRVDVFSVPATYGESFGLYMAEAWAAGLPVVQPRCGAFPELVEATGAGVLCEPDDPDSLARALSALLSDRERREELGRAARTAAVERFTTERMAEEVEAALERVLAPPSAAAASV